MNLADVLVLVLLLIGGISGVVLLNQYTNKKEDLEKVRRRSKFVNTQRVENKNLFEMSSYDIRTRKEDECKKRTLEYMMKTQEPKTTDDKKEVKYNVSMEKPIEETETWEERFNRCARILDACPDNTTGEVTWDMYKNNKFFPTITETIKFNLVKKIRVDTFEKKFYFQEYNRLGTRVIRERDITNQLMTLWKDKNVETKGSEIYSILVNDDNNHLIKFMKQKILNKEYSDFLPMFAELYSYGDTDYIYEHFDDVGQMSNSIFAPISNLLMNPGLINL